MTAGTRIKMAGLALTAADIDDWKRSHRPAANWERWAHCAKAELWQCVALSFGVEPVAATMLAIHAPFFVGGEPKPRPWFAEHRDMKERLEIAVANAGSDALSRLRPLTGESEDIASRLFSTAEFGDWARSIWGDGMPAEFPGNAIPLISIGSQPNAEPIRCLLAPGAGLPIQPSLAPTKRPTGKAPARNDQLLLEILGKLDLDPAAIPRDPGGARKTPTAKSRARQLALTPEYASQGLTEATFNKAWERLPKVG